MTLLGASDTIKAMAWHGARNEHNHRGTCRGRLIAPTADSSATEPD